jgi:hypothetical protein
LTPRGCFGLYSIMGRRIVAAWAPLCAVAALLARAEAQTFDRYEAQFGTPVDVTLTDLVQNGGAYQGRAVRTKGRLDLSNQVGAGRQFVLRDTIMYGGVRLFPVPNIAGDWESEAFTMMGHEIEVTGVFYESSSSQDFTNPTIQEQGVIQFWKYLGPPEKEGKGPEAKPVTLEALVVQPGKRDGQTVRVVGKFRGKNLYGDLPVRSQRESRDWVIKDDVYAIWVTGRKPKGDGFELDTNLKRDTNKWLEVTGRIETRGGVTYLQARSVALTTPPSATADAQPPPPPPEKPKVAPVVVFSLPLDGKEEVTANGRIIIQFNKDMDEQSFRGRVVLRYAGPVRPGDRPFDGMKLSYDWGRRALTVDPGDVLRPGREVEILLLSGISDLEGMALTPRDDNAVEGAVDVLRYNVSS